MDMQHMPQDRTTARHRKRDQTHTVGQKKTGGIARTDKARTHRTYRLHTRTPNTNTHSLPQRQNIHRKTIQFPNSNKKQYPPRKRKGRSANIHNKPYGNTRICKMTRWKTGLAMREKRMRERTLHTEKPGQPMG